MASPFWSPSFFLRVNLLLSNPSLSRRVRGRRARNSPAATQFQRSVAVEAAHLLGRGWGPRGGSGTRRRRRKELKKQRPHKLDSGRRRRRLGACSNFPCDAVPRRLTAPARGLRVPPTPGQLPHFCSPSLQTPLSPGVLSGKKIYTFLKLQNQTRLERQRGVGGEKSQLCLCACVVRLSYDKLRRILKLYYGPGVPGGGVRSLLGPPPQGSPSPRHLLNDVHTAAVACQPPDWFFQSNRPVWEPEPQLSEPDPWLTYPKLHSLGPLQRRPPWCRPS